jgi:hypothetical protein
MREESQNVLRSFCHRHFSSSVDINRWGKARSVNCPHGHARLTAGGASFQWRDLSSAQARTRDSRRSNLRLGRAPPARKISAGRERRSAGTWTAWTRWILDESAEDSVGSTARVSRPSGLPFWTPPGGPAMRKCGNAEIRLASGSAGRDDGARVCRKIGKSTLLHP